MNKILRRENRYWLLLVGLLGFAVMVHLLKPVLIPFLVAAVLAYLGDPIADRLEARGLGRTASVVVVFLSLSVSGLLALVVAVPLLSEQLQLLISKLQLLFAWVQGQLLPLLQEVQGGESQESAKPLSLLTDHWQSAGGLLAFLWKQVAGSGALLTAWAINLTLIPVATFYLLRDWDVLVAHVRELLPRDIEPRVSAIGLECDEIIGAFVRGQMVVMTSLGLVYALGLWALGLDLAFVLGLTAGLASIVPYLGAIVGIGSASVAAYFQFQEWLPVVMVWGVFGLGQMLESLFLTPVLLGDKIGLHPVVVIFAVMAGGQLFGFAGILLALPVTAVIMVLLRHMRADYMSSDLYSAASKPETAT